MSNVCVMAPTVRNPSFIEEYVENARENDFDLDRLHFVLITEDFCDKDEMRDMLEDLGVTGDVFGKSERDEWFESRGLGEYKDIIPEASHSETSFGLLWMWAHEEFEYGVFLDDDTVPHEDFDFFGAHLAKLGEKRQLEFVSSDEDWVNVLYQNFDEHGLYPRGYPYSCMNEDISVEQKESEEIVACQGLWTNIPDLDAVRILMDGDLKGQAQTLTSKEDFKGDFVAEDSNFLTVCSMNLSFKREVIPAFYQFPMDDNQWDIGRFDDIWSGLTLKKAVDMLNKNIVNGYPLCEHNKAERSTFGDLNNEVPGLELNEHFWKALDQAPDEASDFVEAYKLQIEAVEEYDFSDFQNSEFIELVLEEMRRWVEVCERIKS